jgi:2-polyprenyl-6-methoxyphenol hydroxylase-like FAD-dependent oxidoreductase
MTAHGQHREFPVLVVGAGPAGLAMAAGLARNGVGSLVIERHPTVSIFPKASGISTRTMEILRSWGLEDAVRAESLRALPMMSVGETLTGPSQAVAPLGFPTDEQALAVSPTRPAIAPQDRVEPILLDYARRQPGVDIRFGTELTGLEQDADGVTATIRDLESGRDEIVRAAYLVGADGSRSSVRAMLGIEAYGPDDLGTYLTMLFRADLWPALGERRFGLYQLTGAVPGVFVPTGPDDRWVLGMPFDPRSDDAGAFTPERCVELIRRATGLPDLAVELLASMPITFMAQAAERVRDGRAFLIGDAAHRMPPMGGRGLNTAVADAYGRSWKLAWVVRGWAGEALLATHEAERGPVGRFNLGLASPNNPAATPDGLREDLGYVYRSAAIDANDGSEPAPGHLFPATATPGARLPHAWLESPGGRISTLDLVGSGLTLITGAGGQAWLDAVSAVCADVPVGLAGHLVGAELDSRDGVFCERFGLGADGAVLVRPDGHIAWRSEAGTIVDHAAELRSAVDLATAAGPAALAVAA